MKTRAELLSEIDSLKRENEAMRRDMSVIAQKFKELLEFLNIDTEEMDQMDQRQMIGQVVKKVTSLGTMAMVNPNELDNKTSFLNDIGPTLKNIMKYINYGNEHRDNGENSGDNGESSGDNGEG